MSFPHVMYSKVRRKSIMPKSRKLTAAEAKLKKKEYDSKRREKFKNCSESLEKIRAKERLKYLKKKEKGQVKSVSAMSSREKKQKRKQWRSNSLKYRERNYNVRRNLAKLMDETPPASPVSLAEPDSPVNVVKNEAVALRLRRKLRNRQGILYGRIAKLELSLKNEVRKSEKYRKKYKRLNNKIKTYLPKKIYSPDVNISKTIPPEKDTYEYEVGDHVLVTWNNEVYPGKILSFSDNGALVRCMKKESKCWKWPTVKDEELYAWPDVLLEIQPPKLLQ